MSDDAAMDISLPDAAREWVVQRVASGGFASVGEYFRHLVRRDQHEQAVKVLERRLLEGIPEDEVPRVISAADWQRMTGEFLDRLEDRRAKRAG